MSGFHYVYLIDSLSSAPRRHIGVTAEFAAEIARHNRGEVPETARHRPWKLRAVVAFADADRAAAFERYLRTSAGRTFAQIGRAHV